MDIEAAVRLIDLAIESIDEYHDIYGRFSSTASTADRLMGGDSAGTDSTREEALEVEQEKVIPQLEIVRQIALHVHANDLEVSAAPDKSMYNSRPYETNRNTLVVLRNRLERKDELAAVLGPSGPQLASSSLHPTIWNSAATLFDGGHYRQAVQTAGQALEGHLQIHAGPGIAGQDLSKLFASSSSATTTLHFAGIDPESKTYSSARDGAASLIRGAMAAIRNLVSHPGWPDPTEDEALEMLAVFSYVARLVDLAEPQ